MNRQKVIDLLAMSRFANLPTVWSNGLLGALIGYVSFHASGHVCAGCLTMIAVALSCLYLGGCFFNDWHDVAFDTKTRPDRPIPAGRWQRKTILILALILMGTGLILSAIVTPVSGLFAAGIIICILAYTKWHKVHPASFFFMAGARALIYPLAAFSFLSWDQFTSLTPQTWALFPILALGLGGYILGISLTARAETSKTPISDAQKTFPILCLCAPILFFSGPLLLQSPAPALIPLALFIIVLAIIVRSLHTTHDVGQFVSRTLAAIPLVDFLFVFFIAPHFIFWIFCPLLALAARRLQKIAPAT